MSQETLQFVVLLTLVSCLIFAAFIDLITYKIPNRFVILFGLLALPAFLVHDFTWTQWSYHFGIGIIILLIGMLAFNFGVMGGGDAKFLAVTGLWFGLQGVLWLLIASALAGGLLAIIFIGFRALPLPPTLLRSDMIGRLHKSRGPLPFAVAIALGALYAVSFTPYYTAVF